MTTTNNKPTPTELDEAKRYYNDVNEYLKCLTDIIQAQVQEFSEDSEDSDSDDYEELSPAVSQFLNDYKDYVSSLPQVHSQLVGPKSSSPKSSGLRKRLWRYSQNQTLELLPPGDLQQLCEAKLDRSVQVSPSFSTSLPAISNNEKFQNSPSVALLKAQLKKCSKKQEENNRIVIRMPISSFDEPIVEKNIVFVVKKSTAVIAAPPTAVEPPKEQEPIEEEIKKPKVDEVAEKVSSDKKAKRSIIDSVFLSNFLSITKVGFSRTQLSTLVWA